MALLLRAPGVSLTTILVKAIGIFLIGVLALVLCWLAYVTANRQALVLSFPNTDRTFLGKPLLFQTRLTHTRFTPEKIDFAYDYFVVGIPVGLRGNVGGVLAIDTDGTPAKSNCSLLKQCWFNIDQRHYLEPGSHPQGLEGKLHACLAKQGGKPGEWAYAYLVSTPRFLWSTRNIVSWWFLYSKDRQLDALLFEVNNSFGERKVVLMRFERERETVKHLEDTDNRPVKFLHSASQPRMYKAQWKKDIFVSPFEKVGGSYCTKVIDPCLPDLEVKNTFHSVVTLNAPQDDPRIQGIVRSSGKPLDPLSASGPAFAGFLLRWAYVSTLSVARIHFQALRVFLTRSVTYYQRPEVRTTNICREATEAERVFEGYFRLYLGHVVHQSKEPVAVEYRPSRSAYFSPETYRSRMEGPARTLILQVRSPALYTNILEHSDAIRALTVEAKPTLLPADQKSCNLEISDSHLDILKGLLSPELMSGPQSVCGISIYIKQHAIDLLIMGLRGSKSTFMDEFVYKHLDHRMHHSYRISLLYYWLRRRLFIMGSPLMLSVCGVCGQIVFMRALLAWSCGNPTIQGYADDGTLIGYSGALLLIYALWALPGCL